MRGRALGTDHHGLEVHEGASSPLRCHDAMRSLDIVSTFSIRISAIPSPRDVGPPTHLRLDWASVDTHGHRGLRRRGAQQWLGQELAGTTVWLFECDGSENRVNWCTSCPAVQHEADQLCRRCLQADKRSGVVFHVAVHGGGQLGVWEDCDGGEWKQKLKIKSDGAAMGAAMWC